MQTLTQDAAQLPRENWSTVEDLFLLQPGRGTNDSCQKRGTRASRATPELHIPMLASHEGFGKL